MEPRCDLLPRVHAPRNEPRPPSAYALLIEHAPEGYCSLIFTAAYTGMRQSELLGLRWGDVDFEA
jgi:integrase